MDKMEREFMMQVTITYEVKDFEEHNNILSDLMKIISSAYGFRVEKDEEWKRKTVKQLEIILNAISDSDKK